MKSLHIASVSAFSGKTALTLGLGLRMQAAGLNVGYIKPISSRPFMYQDMMVDEDANFVRQTLGLEEQPWELSPVVINEQVLNNILRGEANTNFQQEVKKAFEKLNSSRDIMLIEGAATFHEGFVIGLNTRATVDMLGSHALAVIRYNPQDGASTMADEALSARKRIGDALIGIVINGLPKEQFEYVQQTIVPYLEKQGIAVIGVLPHQQQLTTISVEEVVRVLDAEVLTGKNLDRKLIENLTVGAMSVEAALPRFRRTLNKAVITGGDRTDLQAAALETSTACLILTGNLRPIPTILKRAEELDVAVLSVNKNTIETVESVEKVFGKTRLAQAEKLSRFQAVISQYLNYDRLASMLNI